MSLSFIFGPSGVGKSKWLYREIARRAAQDRKKNFFVIVPDQFTMQTQMDLVMESGCNGIMNIDVLSLSRLNHRIMSEVGTDDIPVLDDTGKSLVLQKVAASMKQELPAIGSFLSRQGYIHEVKSALSEFMQYGLSPNDVDKLIEFSQSRGALTGKLQDLKKLYQGFLSYIREKFVTTEETLDVLCSILPKSDLMANSVVVFDGFTGFTPIQYRVIEQILTIAEDVTVTVSMGENENPYENCVEQNLFYLSKKTVRDLEKIATDAKVPRGKDLFIVSDETAHKNSQWVKACSDRCAVIVNTKDRYAHAPALRHLEKNLFRISPRKYSGENDEIALFEATTPKEEVKQVGLMIHELARKEQAAYRDMALIVGDLAGYAPHIETEFAKLDIPVYMDQTKKILLNPMIEFIKSAIQVFAKDFSYETVFHFLRSGLADFTPEEIDQLENYVLATGLKGRKSYDRLFVSKKGLDRDHPDHLEEQLQSLNQIRESFILQMESLDLPGSGKAQVYVDKLYDFLTAHGVQEKLYQMECRFTEENQPVRAREYAQIYCLVMELLDQIYGLLGDEEITLNEFYEILEAGFGEIKVGTIPQNVDRVLVGDMERTRLKQVKYLFLLGCNDGNIPKSAGKGGIISDMDREFLRGSGCELAPSPRQQMFIQKLYIYLNLTKPSRKLTVSYARMNHSGKAIRPSYLVEKLKELFPLLTVTYPELRNPLEQIVTEQEGASYLADGLRDYAAGVLDEDRERQVRILYGAFDGPETAQKREFLTGAAFKQYTQSGLSKVIAQALYGKVIETSVSRLETFASCAYRYFLQYGLALQEREDYVFENADLGTLYHEVLEKFGNVLAEQKITWFDFTEEFAQTWVHTLLENAANLYNGTILYSNARYVYSLKRMERILYRTVMTLQKQLKKGVFLPDAYEVSFRFTNDLKSVNLALSDTEKLALRGRIDRVDVTEDEENVYVKVVDYKSGNRHFDLAALYYGLQLQLVVYMNAAAEIEKKYHPDKNIVPAALLYYHINDPVIETPVELSDEALNQEILKQLRTNGVVNSDEGIVERLDKELQERSDVIPVEKKKDNTFSARASVLSGEDLQVVSEFTTQKMKEIGRRILGGDITKDPYELGTDKGCTYCPYKGVCGFDILIPGCEERVLENLDRETALKFMKEYENGSEIHGESTEGH